MMRDKHIKALASHVTTVINRQIVIVETAAIKDEMDVIKAEIETIKKGPDTSDIKEDLDEIKEEIDELKNQQDISGIEAEMKVIKAEIETIKKGPDTSDIQEDLAKIQEDIAALNGKLEKVGEGSVRISPTPPIGVEDLNGTAYTALLASVSTPQGAEEYYSAVISPIIANNDGDLTAPISRSELNAAVCSSLFTEQSEPVTWKELTSDAKMAYVMQFILANESNQTRAIYLTNEILKGLSVDFRSMNDINQEFLANFLAPQIEDDPALILPENAGIRMRSCPYLLS
jgi:hypothetical protein